MCVLPLISALLESGDILVARRINRELMQNPNISLIIRVTDSPSGGNSNEITIVIIIEDKNDNPPECKKYNFRSDYFYVITSYGFGQVRETWPRSSLTKFWVHQVVIPVV